MRLANVSKSFGELRVLDAFSADFPEHGFIGVSGASGSGKTTLLRIMAGLESPDAGAVEDAPERVSVQFEDDRLFPWMNAQANVALVGCNDEQARKLLDEMNLGDKLNARISELSGGQRRRVALARALAFPAPLYLFDEPTARLDEDSAELVLDVIWQHCAESLVIIASHDRQALSRCDFVLEI